MHTLSYHSKLHHLINDSIYKDQVVPYAAYHGRKNRHGETFEPSVDGAAAMRPMGSEAAFAPRFRSYHPP